MVVTYTANWINDSAGAMTYWHCYAFAVIADRKKGKHLIIWDCDPVEGGGDKLHVRRLRFGQRDLIQWIRKNKLKTRGLLRVWYNVDISRSGYDRCVSFTCSKIQEWVTMGDTLFLGDKDPRIEGCIQITSF